jgi:hypothetical protein
VVAFDGAERTLLRALAEERRLPAIEALLSRGAALETEAPAGVYAGAIWPSLRTAALYPGERSVDLPDFLVEWHRDAPVRGARSAKIGTMRRAQRSNRTGDHRRGGLFLAAGPGIPKGRGIGGPIRVEDVAPTIAGLLDVRLEDVDGRPVMPA